MDHFEDLKITLYHGSPIEGIKVLKPKASDTVDGEEVVFASIHKWVAIASTAKWSDNDFSQGIKNGVPYMREMYKGAFEKIYKTGGSIYLVEDSGFKSDKRLTNYEVITTSPVKVLKEVKIKDQVDALKKEGVKLIYFKK